MSQFIRPTVDKAKVRFAQANPDWKFNPTVNLECVQYYKAGTYLTSLDQNPVIQFSIPEHEDYVLWIFNNQQELDENLTMLNAACGVSS